MAGPGGRVVATVVGRVVSVTGTVVGAVVGAVVGSGVDAAVVGTAVSFPVGGGPVVATVVTAVVWTGTGVVSDVVIGSGVVAGAGVTTAGGSVTITMVGGWGVEVGWLSLRMYGVIPMRAARMVPMVAMSWIQGKVLFFSSSAISGSLRR
jgi:hypothetical protein